ncbi:MAG TPA: hypothetical protein VM890_08425 [Longimicrobium sp.]|jgi:hypothetical protein|nr:hypothetical protein [Longimicrobium sp.]
MKAALSVALALLLAACSESTGPGGDLRVETDKSAYSLPGGPGVPSALVKYTVRNTGSETVALPNCGEAISGELQRREGGEWVTVGGSGVCPAFAIYAPVVLAPGEEASGQTAVGVAGQYRILVRVADEVGAEFASQALSPDFTVRWLED